MTELTPEQRQVVSFFEGKDKVKLREVEKKFGKQREKAKLGSSLHRKPPRRKDR